MTRPGQSIWQTIFQSTLPRGERRILNGDTIPVFQISIHAPTRGATLTPKMYYGSFIHFNPRSHEGSDTSIITLSCSLRISIHAPTRGATSLVLLPLSISNYFNPRSHEGSDQFRKHSRAVPYNFNPRSHEGSDLFRK